LAILPLTEISLGNKTAALTLGGGAMAANPVRRCVKKNGPASMEFSPEWRQTGEADRASPLCEAYMDTLCGRLVRAFSTLHCSGSSRCSTASEMIRVSKTRCGAAPREN